MKQTSRILLAAITVFSVVAMMAAPAGAAQGGGVVSGGVAVSPGLDTTCVAQSFTFNDTVISGTFVNAPDGVAGTIAVPPITGGSTSLCSVASGPVGETSAFGTGYVNGFTAGITPVAGTVTGSANCNQAPLGRAGDFQRVGGVVLVELKCNIVVNGVTTPSQVLVAALFVPSAGNGVTTKATHAAFNGVFVLA